MTKLRLMTLVGVWVTYPFFGLKIILAELTHPFGMNDLITATTLPIFSTHEDQKLAARKSLKELLVASNTTISKQAIHQPPQVVAAAYARKLNQRSWRGWEFADRPVQLPVIRVNTTTGVSEHHHKRFINYNFSATDQLIKREDALINGVDVDEWSLSSRVMDRAKPIAMMPKDFLLWFDEKKQDRSDVVDANLMAQSLNLYGRPLQKLFYNIKFEFADVLTFESFHGNVTGNLPAGIFVDKPSTNLGDSLTGILMGQRPRPNVKRIYLDGVQGRLPDHEWNGKWESNVKS